MQSRCRPGDLAFILRDDPGYEENIGRIVMVHGPARLDPQIGVTWLIVPVTRQPYAVCTRNGKLYDCDLTVEDGIEHPDDWMMPIRPEALSEERDSVQYPSCGDEVTS